MQSSHRPSALPESLPYIALHIVAYVPPDLAMTKPVQIAASATRLFTEDVEPSSWDGIGSPLVPLLPRRAASCLCGAIGFQSFDQPYPDSSSKAAGRRRSEPLIIDRCNERIDRQPGLV